MQQLSLFEDENYNEPATTYNSDIKLYNDDCLAILKKY